MSKILGWIKEHPYISAGIIGGLGISFIFLRGGNSGTAATTDDTGAYLSAEAQEVSAGQAFQTAQLQANQAALVSNNQAAVSENQVTGAEVIAQLQSQDTLAGIAAQQNVSDTTSGLQASTQQNADTLAAQTTQAVSLLQAQVAEANINAATQQTQINANAYVDIATAPYSSADYIASLQNTQLLQNLATANQQITTLNQQLHPATPTAGSA